jgi:2-keto-4-pentenoate hydratase/2-oxohepta-3-ene-1,7-dioic acid hydratase in catechol pathway
MRLYSYELEGRRSLGAEWQGQMIDLPSGYAALLRAQQREALPQGRLPCDMLAFLRLGNRALEAARAALAFMSRRPPVPVGERVLYGFDELRLLPPVPRPGKILCAGVNFKQRLRERPTSIASSEGSFFIKVSSAVAGPGEAVVRPQFVRELDYGIELAAILGAKLKAASQADAMEAVAGYTILNDVTARDVRMHQATLGKNYDSFCPLGPCLVTADEVPDPARLRLRTWINGELRQDDSTADWVLSLPSLLAALSRVMTLEPGDIVSTGTPAGSALSYAPGKFLKPGDRIRMEIEGIGVLETPVVTSVGNADFGPQEATSIRSGYA